MGVFSYVGEGDQESIKELLDAMDEYTEYFYERGIDANLIKVELLKEEDRQNSNLAAIYRRCIKEGKTVDEIVKYDGQYREDVEY